ncbi:Rrf2 family transcriptional regulator [Novosphingobium sp. FKTRR1]|uniref:RrF2 family transcriptional regulator n=1 Tax=unclassified Novosphingobium TaxID=2644732 RepID=UPI001CEFFC00|nr:Rrf2 family transcriptional regulator [Novosphingobium sp. FKTRR1]
MLSQRARYALKALLAIARGDGSPQQVSAIAEQESIPRKFLETIMSDLRRAGIVTSTRGNAGGYRLARPADLISFADILRATDGPIAMLPCVSRNFYERCEDCTSEARCALRKVFSEVRDAANTILENRTLASAIAPHDDAPHTEASDQVPTEA